MLALTLLAVGCSRSAVYMPYDTDLVNRRGVLMLDTQGQNALPEHLAIQEQDRIEASLAASPHMGPVTTRAEFSKRAAENARLENDYTTFSDSMVTAGLGNWEQALRLSQGSKREMLLGFQVYYLPCVGCEGGDQIAATAHMVHGPTGLLVWRATFIQPTSGEAPALEKSAREVANDVLRAFNSSMRPKWHRERFRNLSRREGERRELQRDIVKPTGIAN